MFGCVVAARMPTTACASVAGTDPALVRPADSVAARYREAVPERSVWEAGARLPTPQFVGSLGRVSR